MAIVRCSFCGLSQNNVPRLVASSTSFTAICTSCTLAVIEMFVTNGDPKAEDPQFELTPLGIQVAERIIGEARQ